MEELKSLDIRKTPFSKLVNSLIEFKRLFFMFPYFEESLKLGERLG